MERPKCYNREPYKDKVMVQDGWLNSKHIQHPFLPPVASRVPLMKEIADPMSKTCKQHGHMGEAALHPEKWACGGCKWRPENVVEQHHG